MDKMNQPQLFKQKLEIRATRDEVVNRFSKPYYYDANICGAVPIHFQYNYTEANHRCVEKIYEILVKLRLQDNDFYIDIRDLPADVMHEIIEVGKAIGRNDAKECCIYALEHYFVADSLFHIGGVQLVQYLWDEKVVKNHQSLLRIQELLLPFLGKTREELLVAIPKEVLLEIAGMKSILGYSNDDHVRYLGMFFKAHDQPLEALVKYLWGR